MHHRPLNLLTASLATILFSTTALAQQPAPAPDPRADVAFTGGTVQQFVDAVTKSFGAANTAVAPDAASITVAPVQLKAVTRHDAVTLLEALSSGRVAVMPRGETFMVIADLNVEEQRLETPIIRVWPLAKTLARMKPEEALSAVQAALDLAGEGASVKFHPDTSLLIVRGTGRQIDAVSQVVDRLENVAGYREGEAERARCEQSAAAVEEEVRALQAEVARLSAELKALMQASPSTTPGTAR